MGLGNITAIEYLFIFLILVFIVPTSKMVLSIGDSMDKMKVLYANEYIEAHKHGFEWNRLFDLWISFAAAVACYVEQTIVYYLVQPTIYSLCKEKKDEAMRVIKTNKASEKTY